jgi:polysaccharide biosynthesis protein PslH
MKAVICCFYQAYPPSTGAGSVSYNLAKFAGAQNVLIQIGLRDERFETPDGVEVVTLAGASESHAARLVRLPSFVNRMVAEIARVHPDLVILEGASWALYHWMLMTRLRWINASCIVIYHSHNVEYLLRCARHSRPVAMLTRWAEGRLLRQADISTAVSEVDRDHMARLYGVTPILLRNGVDIERFAHPDPAAVERMREHYGLDGRTLLFAGFYAYGPNREAIDFLVESVMPPLRERYPSATLALTGGDTPFRESWVKTPGAIPYEDFAAFVSACGIVVAPIFSGSGSRLKILEAMAAGVPVVATEKAAEGLWLRHGEHALFAHGQGDFVDRISAVFEDPELAVRLRTVARQKAVTEFSWYSIARDFQRAVDAHAS